jgi:hypothetical protein
MIPHNTQLERIAESAGGHYAEMICVIRKIPALSSRFCLFKIIGLLESKEQTELCAIGITTFWLLNIFKEIQTQKKS